MWSAWLSCFLRFLFFKKVLKPKKAWEWKKAGETVNEGLQKLCVSVTVSEFLICRFIVGPVFRSFFELLVLLELHVLSPFLFFSVCCLGAGVLRWLLPSLVHASSLDLLRLFHLLRNASRRPLALLALNKENFAEVGERILTCSLLPLQTKHDSLWRILRRSTRLLT